MEEATDENPPAQEIAVPHSGVGWQILWFLLHVAAVYVIVNVCTPLLARWAHDDLLPFLQHPSSLGRFEYLYSHLFAFSFVPGFVTGLVNSKFKHKAAQFVWLLPATILAYKFATFPSPSVLQSQFSAAFHQYFGGGFVIPDFRNWHELLSTAASIPDMTRGRAQTNFTAPLYAGVGYSFAALIGFRTELSRKVAEKVRRWEESRFEDHSSND
jgi:hypothetical protein